MADFSKPVSTDSYANVLSYLKATTSDLALGLDPATTSPTNVPTNAVRWSSVSAKWQKWNGTTWNDLASSYAINISGTAAGLSATLAIASGGTGATTAAAALVSLGERTGANGSTKLPSGTSAQRDGSPSTGFIRFNTDLLLFEGYNGSAWTSVGGGIADGAVTQAKIADGAVTPAKLSTGGPAWDASGNLQFNSGYGSTAVAYGCRAWVNFNGFGSIGANQTIRGAGNVSSVYKHGTGEFSINFVTAMPDANYVIITCVEKSNGSYIPSAAIYSAAAPSAGSFRILTGSENLNNDRSLINVAVIR